MFWKDLGLAAYTMPWDPVVSINAMGQPGQPSISQPTSRSGSSKTGSGSTPPKSKLPSKSGWLRQLHHWEYCGRRQLRRKRLPARRFKGRSSVSTKPATPLVAIQYPHHDRLQLLRWRRSRGQHLHGQFHQRLLVREHQIGDPFVDPYANQDNTTFGTITGAVKDADDNALKRRLGTGRQ